MQAMVRQEELSLSMQAAFNFQCLYIFSMMKKLSGEIKNLSNNIIAAIKVVTVDIAMILTPCFIGNDKV